MLCDQRGVHMQWKLCEHNNIMYNVIIHCIYMNAGNRLHECTKIGCGTLIRDGLQYTPKENISNLVIVII